MLTKSPVSYVLCRQVSLFHVHACLFGRGLVGPFNKEMVLVGAFSRSCKTSRRSAGSSTGQRSVPVPSPCPWHPSPASTTQHPSQPCPVIGLVICYMDCWSTYRSNAALHLISHQHGCWLQADGLGGGKPGQWSGDQGTALWTLMVWSSCGYHH